VNGNRHGGERSDIRKHDLLYSDRHPVPLTRAAQQSASRSWLPDRLCSYQGWPLPSNRSNRAIGIREAQINTFQGASLARLVAKPIQNHRRKQRFHSADGRQRRRSADTPARRANSADGSNAAADGSSLVDIASLGRGFESDLNAD